MLNLINYFPKEYTPRPTQTKAIQEIDRAISDGYQYIICCLPTGSGKSFIPSTLANYSKEPTPDYLNVLALLSEGAQSFGSTNENPEKWGCATLTVSKVLQNQYDDLFDHSNILKGRHNYICQVDNDFDCEVAPCTFTPSVYKDCLINKKCSYFNERESALLSKFGVFNYNMYLCLQKQLNQRQFIVCDEADKIEDELVSFYSVKLDYKRIDYRRLNIEKLESDNPNYAFNWLVDVIAKVNNEIMFWSNQMGNQNSSKNKRLLSGSVNNFKYYKNLWDRLNNVKKNWYASEYVVEYDDERAEFIPLHVGNLAKNNIFNNAEHIILMGATISDHEMLAKSLGIEKYKYIELDSTFDSQKSPIYCSSKYALNYRSMDKVLPNIINQIEILCKQHKDDKGIIHCHNFKIVEAIQVRLGKDKRFLFRDMGMSNEALLQEHRISKLPTVLVSPSMDTGVSLDDDLGRFQIIVKAPYLPLGSKRIKTLFERDSKWYNFKMLNSLIQATGRCTRSEDDHAITYILDATATKMLKSNFDKLPLHIRERIH